MKRVFEPASIRNLELKNRLIMSAMVTHYSTENGEVTPRLVAYHRERARGGVAMTETEAAYVHPGGKGYAHQLGIYSDDVLPGLKWLVRVIHAHGAKVMAQIFHAGRRTSKAMTGYDVVVPSAVAFFEGDEPPKSTSGPSPAESDAVKELTPIHNNAGVAETLRADSVILAVGYSSHAPAEGLIPRGSPVRVFSIGDCVKPRRFLDAIREAYQLAYSL